MDDRQGDVIDGTARARHWRHRGKLPASAEGAESRSEAPKSIAASLLVPAEMFEPAVGEQTDEDARSGGASDAAQAAGLADNPSPGVRVDENLFLSPGAGTPGAGRIPEPRRARLAERIGRMVEFAGARRWASKPADNAHALTRRSRVSAALTRRSVAIALGLSLVIALTTGILTASHSPSTGLAFHGGSHPVRTLAYVDQMKSGMLASAAARFAALRASHQAARTHVRHPVAHHRRHQRHRSRPAHSRTPTSSSAEVTVQYTPSTTTSVTSSSPSDATTTTPDTTATTIPAAPTTPPSTSTPSAGSEPSHSSQQSTGSSSQPAFGANGVLGPGHGNGTG